MRLFILFLFLVSLIACSDKTGNGASENKPTISTNNDGDWESSGGSGVACFKTSEAAEEYDRAIQSKMALTDEMIASIDTLKTLEYWEKPDIQWITGNSSEEIVTLVHERLRMSAALFAKKMYDVRKLIQVQLWNKTYQLDVINDAHPARDVKEENNKCRLIQLAVRYTQPTPLEEIPPVKVSFDSRLWEKLDSINQAILFLHEEIYLIGKQTGHKDSRYTRILVNVLMNKMTWAIPDPDYLAMKVQNEINFGFGDYIHVLYNSSPLPENPQPFTSESRYRSFRIMIQKIRSYLDTCSKLQDKEVEKCREENFQNVKDGSFELTDEEAFLFYYRWEITYQHSGLLNSEIVSVYWPDPDFEKIAASAMGKACNYIIIKAMKEHSHEKDPLEKSKAYCLAAGYKIIDSGSTEINQN